MSNVIIPPPSPLSVQAVHDAIDASCLSFNGKFRRATKNDLHGLPLTTLAYFDILFYGVVNNSTIEKTRNSADSQNLQLVATFYFAYSTWDGRFLYLDRDDTCGSLQVRQLLTDIAVRCQCSRFTWQHLASTTSTNQQQQQQLLQESEQSSLSNDSTLSETMHGWLTLYWPQTAMKKFLKSSVDVDTILEVTNLLPRQVIQNCLTSHPQLSHEHFTMRLASSDDLESIQRLVQGLADFEKEPNAVHVTRDHYLNDGYSDNQNDYNSNSDSPKSGNLSLFYCLLLDHTTKKGTTKSCGMAFSYMGCTCENGRFWYLEDLFIEDAYRGKGAGTFIMQTLATIALSLHCSRLVWQALDWNTPALNFYHKIGAQVADGVLTTRFAGDNLHKFCMTSRNSK